MNVKIFVFLALVAAAASNPDGAPDSACFTMLPGHGSLPQTSPSPVRIVISDTTIRPGQTITIRIEGINPAFQFRGFMLQARNVVAPNSPLGSVTRNDGANFQPVICGDGPTTATHITNIQRNVQTVIWTAPAVTAGVRFHLTVVENIERFWFQILSDIVDVNPGN